MRKLFLQLSIVIVSLLSFSVFVPALAAAADCDPNNTADAIECGTNGASGVPGGGANSTTQLNNTVTNVVNLLSVAVGVVAVIMIMVAGFRYVTSSGDTTKVGAAKSTLLYAAIGLAIVALAQVAVHFVLNKTDKATTGMSSQIERSTA